MAARTLRTPRDVSTFWPRRPSRSLLPALTIGHLKNENVPTHGLVARFGAIQAEAGAPLEMSLDRTSAFLDAAAIVAHDEHLGVSIAGSVGRGVLGPLEYGWRNARTLGQLLSFVATNYRIFANDTEVTWRVQDDVAVYAQTYPKRATVSRHATEFFVAYTLRQMRELTRTDLAIVEVAFPNPQPKTAAKLRSLLGVQRLRFGASETRVVIRADQAELAVHGADPALFEIMCDYLRILLEQDVRWMSDAQHVAVQLKSIVRARLGREPVDLENLAAACRLSPRTLQRKLESAGTTLRALVLEARREEAFSAHEKGAGLSLELARSLGYVDQNALRRAFKRWVNGPHH